MVFWGRLFPCRLVGEIAMPEVSRFYGIVVKMFFKPKEH